MAWPRDARDVSYAAGQQVPSSNLNAIQDEIIKAHELRTKTFFPKSFENKSASDDMSWTPEGGLTPWFGALEAGRDAWIHLEFDQAVVITEVKVKVYVGAAGLFVRLDKVDLHTDDTDTAAPTFTNVEAPVLGGTPPGWDVASMTGLSHTVLPDEVYLVRIADADIGDKVAGATVKYYPFAP